MSQEVLSRWAHGRRSGNSSCSFRFVPAPTPPSAFRGRAVFLQAAPPALTCGTLAVTAVLGSAGVGGIAAGEAAVVIHVQQQASGAPGAVLAAGTLAFHATLVAFFTVKVFSLLRTEKRWFLSAEVLTRCWSSQMAIFSCLCEQGGM